MTKTYDYMIGVDEISVETLALTLIRTRNAEIARVNREVVNAGKVCQRSTKARCPVGTPQSTGKKNYKGGTLKKSYYTMKGTDDSVIVWTSVPYGKFVELGTVKMKAQPHLYPGFLDGAIYLMAALKVQL